MTPAEHRELAEELLGDAFMDGMSVSDRIAAAHVHALLAHQPPTYRVDGVLSGLPARLHIAPVRSPK